MTNKKKEEGHPLAGLLAVICFISIPVFFIGLLIDNDTMLYGGVIVCVFSFLGLTLIRLLNG